MFRQEPKWYVGSWLGGFGWPIFVGVDGFAYGKTAANVVGRSGCVGGTLCHFVVEQVFSGAFEEAMRWCACEMMASGGFVLVHAGLCSVQLRLPRRKCA